jgi:16S rRNA (cytosine967-C5)-methyltransferase
MAGQQGQDLRLAAVHLLAEAGELELERSPHLAKLAHRDRQLARALVLGVLRNKNLLDFYLSHFLKSGMPEQLPPPVLNILRVALFQLKFMDRVPDHAAVDQAVELTRKLGVDGLSGLVNGVLRNCLRGWDKVPEPIPGSNPVRYLETVYSHPGWMAARYLERFGLANAKKLLAANNTQPPLVLRDEAVAAKGVSRLAGQFKQAGVQTRAGRFTAEALEILTPGTYPPELPGYALGLFYVQDEAAMLVSRLAAAGYSSGPVVAACAAPGGKATHLARLLPDAAVLACDSSSRRLGRMRANLERLGLGDRIELVSADARCPAVSPGCAGLVICDVPCTGTGVIRRKPDIRWRIGPGDLKVLSQLQFEILIASSALVAPGGGLVYSTCSLEPEENIRVVERFLAEKGGFSLVPAGGIVPAVVVGESGCLETLPQRHSIDGTFAALMVRNG